MAGKSFDDGVLEENHKYFKFYLALPNVVFIILMIIFGILGLITLVDGFGFLIWIGGVIISLLTYYLMKVTLSYNVLHIYYLKKIAEKDEVK
jgi:hypothetical protein